MTFATWQELYKSDLQSAVAVTIVPLLFLLYLIWTERREGTGVVPAAARFVHVWAGTFALLTIIDPLATGPLLRALAVADAPVATVVMVAFVLLGDFRVYWLLFAVALRDVRRGARLAAAVTPAVPLLAYASDRLIEGFAPDATGQRLWLIHELMFTGVALWLWSAWLPRRVADAATLRFLRRVCAYVIVYYALWAACDALWLAASLDVAWLLRALPNQLYYAFFVPFVWLAYSRRG